MVYQVNTLAEFEKYIKENEKVVVDIYASWCGPCKMYAPIISDASNARSNITFIKVDSDQVSEVAERYEIYSVPTLLMFKNGSLVSEQVGYMPLDRLLSEIDKAL